MTQRLFKVLVDGRSCHGGDMQWSLPHHDGTRWIPGEWHEISGPIEICSRGIHGTKDPRVWLKHGCRVWSMEAEEIEFSADDKFVCRRARLLRPCHHPKWWRKAEKFIGTLKGMKWCQPDGQPDGQWVLFEADTLAAAGAAAWDAAWTAAGDAAWDAAGAAAWTAAGAPARTAARAAAGAAAGDAARTAAWDAAGDAVLKARLSVCDGLPIDPKHIAHVNARWRVWQKGYCLLCDVDGVLYVYAKRRTA